MTIVKKKRAETGTCNICLKEAPLSWDHIPPKSGITIQSVEIENIYKLLTNKPQQKLFLQNGFKYRTICRDCNAFLGVHYDRSLNDFNKDLAMFLKSKLILPPSIYIRTKPLRLIKAILGHLLAASETIGQTIFDNQIRSFILRQEMPIPESLHIHYWIYPYDSTIIMRDFGMPAVRGNMSTHIFCHVFKYFPVAFLIGDQPAYEGLPSLSAYNSFGPDEEAELRIDLKRIETEDWPERIDNSNIVFASAETLNALRARPRKK